MKLNVFLAKSLIGVIIILIGQFVYSFIEGNIEQFPINVFRVIWFIMIGLFIGILINDDQEVCGER